MRASANRKAAAARTATGGAAALGDSELGEVKIHENVIASLVRKAALSVEGVSRLACSSLVDNIAEFVGNRRMARAIAIEMDDGNRVMLEIKLVLKSGYNIPEIAPQVQKAVIEEVEKVTGMTVTKVSVLFQDIDDAVPEDEDAQLDSIPLN